MADIYEHTAAAHRAECACRYNIYLFGRLLCAFLLCNLYHLLGGYDNHLALPDLLINLINRFQCCLLMWDQLRGLTRGNPSSSERLYTNFSVILRAFYSLS